MVVAAAILLLPLALIVGLLLCVGVPTGQGAQRTRLAAGRSLLPYLISGGDCPPPTCYPVSTPDIPTTTLLVRCAGRRDSLYRSGL